MVFGKQELQLSLPLMFTDLKLKNKNMVKKTTAMVFENKARNTPI
jgi:hypothetical protein